MVSITILNGRMLRRPEDAHPYLARMLRLPDWYGANLDALYDCLTEKGPCTLVVLGAEALRQEGGWGARALAVLEDAARDNPHLMLETEADL